MLRCQIIRSAANATAGIISQPKSESRRGFHCLSAIKPISSIAPPNAMR